MFTESVKKEFLNRYRIEILSDYRPRFVYTTSNLIPYDESYRAVDHVIKQENCVVLAIPESDLKTLIEFYDRVNDSIRSTGSLDIFYSYVKSREDKTRQEEEFRKNNPAVQKAYDHYLTMRALASSGKTDGR
jgi:hypothetical protein